MKITQQELKQIILEEVQKELLLHEQGGVELRGVASMADQSRGRTTQQQIYFLWASLKGLAGSLDQVVAKNAAPAEPGTLPAGPQIYTAEQKTKL